MKERILPKLLRDVRALNETKALVLEPKVHHTHEPPVCQTWNHLHVRRPVVRVVNVGGWARRVGVLLLLFFREFLLSGKSQGIRIHRGHHLSSSSWHHSHCHGVHLHHAGHGIHLHHAGHGGHHHGHLLLLQEGGHWIHSRHCRAATTQAAASTTTATTTRTTRNTPCHAAAAWLTASLAACGASGWAGLPTAVATCRSGTCISGTAARGRRHTRLARSGVR
mmetsp:Transcript_50815/g.104876  ORF Transcript_50815/g.104876 Transcript_50815/m.104876 type:complete len:222 (-) Transcript_50815:138-803(-)